MTEGGERFAMKSIGDSKKELQDILERLKQEDVTPEDLPYLALQVLATTAIQIVETCGMIQEKL